MFSTQLDTPLLTLFSLLTLLGEGRRGEEIFSLIWFSSELIGFDDSLRRRKEKTS